MKMLRLTSFCSRTWSYPMKDGGESPSPAKARGKVGPTSMVAASVQFLILLVGSWLRRHQGEALEYLRAENRVLRARLGPQRLRFTDPERRPLATRSISGHVGDQMQRLCSTVSNGEQVESLTRILKLMPPPVGKDGGPGGARLSSLQFALRAGLGH
jgi:hypothetical protein